MAGTEAVAIDLDSGRVRALRPDGVRVVTRENGRYFDLMPSTLSSYLLSTLADFSLIRREARSPVSSLRFTGAVVELEEIGGGGELGGLRSLFWPTGIGLGSFGSPTWISGESLGWFGVRGSIGRVGAGMGTAPAFTVTSPDVEAATDLLARRQLTLLGLEASEAAATENALAPDARIAEVASRITTLSKLSDELLAELFKVERETFCRWRTGALKNPRVGNRRRLALLLALLEELHGRRVVIKDWLLNSVATDDLTPYELLKRGRIDEVAYLAATVGEPPVERDARVSGGGESEPLEFGDDDVWEFEPDDDEH